MKSILVADDDSVFRRQLVKALSARGYQVLEAKDAAEAILISQKTPTDAAVLDLRMPGASGLDLLENLHALNPSMKIVFLTGYGSIATALEAVRKGAVDYLTKPTEIDSILAALNGTRSTEPGTLREIPSLSRVEWEHIQRVLQDCDGNITIAAKKLGIHRRSLQRKLDKLP